MNTQYNKPLTVVTETQKENEIHLHEWVITAVHTHPTMVHRL